EFLSEVKRAIKVYQDKETWDKIVRAGMKEDFSWHSSAKKYIELYKTILDES
ncbi:MAG: glycogen synthase GlgA, partial [Chlorobiota bacterium]